MTGRAEFLERIRREVDRTAGLFAATPAARPADPAEAAEALRRQMAERWPDALRRFRQEFEGVGGVFHRVASLDEVPGLVRDLARQKGVGTLAAWETAVLGVDLRARLEPEGLRVTPAPPNGAPDASARHAHREAAARAGIGVTTADFALAETGTLILISGGGRPRATSLLPETHVAVFGRAALLETLEQVGIVLEALHAAAAMPEGGIINFITGPSRTADIELTLTRGVHGPKDVHAVFVEAS